MWTPALSGAGDDIPHGLIFAALMLSVMAGSLLNDLFKQGLKYQQKYGITIEVKLLRKFEKLDNDFSTRNKAQTYCNFGLGVACPGTGDYI